MLRKLWKIAWISAVSFIGFVVIAGILISIFVPEEELEQARQAEIARQAAKKKQEAEAQARLEREKRAKQEAEIARQKAEAEKRAIKEREEAERRERLKTQLDLQIIVSDYIESRMHNPKSFKHVKTTYTKHPRFYIVTMTYRGTNLYNAIVTNTIRVKVNMNGRVIEVLSNSP